jgi:hypothetical protein
MTIFDQVWEYILGLFGKRGRATRLVLEVRAVRIKNNPEPIWRGRRKLKHMKITDEQAVDLSIAFETAAGNPARVDGVPVWENSNPEVVDLIVAEDGLTASATSKGPLGLAQISVTADADLGEGVRPLTAIGELEVVAAEAARGVVTFGTPRLKAAA